MEEKCEEVKDAKKLSYGGQVLPELLLDLILESLQINWNLKLKKKYNFTFYKFRRATTDLCAVHLVFKCLHFFLEIEQSLVEICRFR